jgi:hypothetical protein
VIVRLMGEGQYRLADDAVRQLNELDNQAQAAVEAEDEPRLDTLLEEMWELVRSAGEPLPEDDLSASDAVVPPSDMTLEETKRFLNTEGLIPDLG